jgi:hypothetical protein
MKAKCYLAKGPELDMTMMELLALARGDAGKDSLGSLSNDRAGISLSRNREALILVGGRDSIHDFLLYQGVYPQIIGAHPFLVSFARKHRVFGKNETCLKIVCGGGHHQPNDGSEFAALPIKGRAERLTVTPPELAHCLHFMYGWG